LWAGLNWLTIGTCDVIENLGSIKAMETLDQLSDCCLLQKSLCCVELFTSIELFYGISDKAMLSPPQIK
jgi:hypothetical protein